MSIEIKAPFFVIAGPCVVESKSMLQETASELVKICGKLGAPLYFKASYKKANRTSHNSFSGIGDELALGYLAEIKQEFGVPVITDIHSADEARYAAEFVDVLQIPAFLCRQTDILHAAGETGKTINVKKGQFMPPYAMKEAANKIAATGNTNIWLTERGTSFGYSDLIVDFRSLLIMKSFGYPVVYDATHSVQKPSLGKQSGGAPEYSPALARGAAAVGINGLFMETHPDPKNAKSDAATQISLSEAEIFISNVVKIHKFKESIL